MAAAGLVLRRQAGPCLAIVAAAGMGLVGVGAVKAGDSAATPMAVALEGRLVAAVAAEGTCANIATKKRGQQSVL